MIEEDSLYLYHLTLKQASGAFKTCTGRFRGLKKSEEIVLANSTTLEVWIPDSETGKIKKETVQHAFGIIQSIEKIRLTASSKDLLAITSDSGKLVVAEFNLEGGKFIPIVQEPHSKSFLRRNTPGQYLAVDPENRAIMIAAVERNKLVYKVESKSEKLHLSSPLEAVARNTLTLAVCAMDVGFENPLFAAIEVDYTDYELDENLFDANNSELQLNYYELDQSLNYVTRAKPKSIPSSASSIIALPNVVGGCLITCESFLIYEHPQRLLLYVPLPVREGTDLTKIVNHVVHRLPKDEFFVLMQSSFGDLFKVTVTMDEDEEMVRDIKVLYFETIPACNSINILRSGFLFANVLNNNKMFFQFESLGDDEEYVETLHLGKELNEILNKIGQSTFKTRTERHISLVDVIDSLEPIVDAALLETMLKDSPDPIKKLALLSSNSFLKEIQHGFQTSELAESQLPINATDVFVTKLTSDATNDEYMVISSSLSLKTIVLSIGEDVEEVTDSKFVTDQATLGVQQVGKLSLVQVYANGIRHVNSVTKKTTDWFPPAGIHVSKVASNNFQVVIALTNFEVVYFEVDPVDDQLIEYQDRLELSIAISAMGILTSQNQKSPFVILGGTDETIQVISLSLHNCLEVKLMQALSSNSSSILIRGSNAHIGMEDGMFVTTSINLATGKLSDSRSQYLGSMPVKLSAIKYNATDCVLAISSASFLGYSIGNGAFKITPLIGVDITSGGAINSEDLGEIVVGVKKNEMRLYKLGTEEQDLASLEDDIAVVSKQLRFQPRRFVTKNNFKYIIESEFNTKSPFPQTHLKPYSVPTSKQESSKVAENFVYERKSGSWASCIQVLDVNNELVQTLELSDNKAAISVCIIGFETEENANSGENFLVVGITKDLKYLPKSSSSASYLLTFRIQKDGNLKFIHSTVIESQPTVMTLFAHKLLVGSGNHLRLYDLGRNQLLRKSTTQVDYLAGIIKLSYQGNQRIAIGDANKSTIFATFDAALNQFVMFADDIKNRQITALTALDYDTIVGGDKFGNIFVNRCSPEVSKMADEYWTKFQDARMNGSGSRVKNLCEFYVNDVPTVFIKGSLVYGVADTIIYTGIQGTIGLLLPLATRSEVEFFSKLELTMRKYLDFNFDDFDKDKQGYNLLGKDHLKFRGYYNPSKNVIDGDFIDRFFEQTALVKLKIAKEVDRTPREVEKKISDLRLRVAF